jgi:hypothetical protein
MRFGAEHPCERIIIRSRNEQLRRLCLNNIVDS